ncbi:MAG: hypothetical protein K2J90_02430 [Lachnospiraceae bacterium]|nr:hypothetical protein [Lachnospiraceae bacterium]
MIPREITEGWGNDDVIKEVEIPAAMYTKYIGEKILLLDNKEALKYGTG